MVVFFKPLEVSDIDVVFPANVMNLMPAYKDIPEEFRNFNSKNKWNKLFNDWFYRGIINLQLDPKDGIDTNKALRHIKAIMGSFQPKHEHKEAAVAYLFSLWFKDVKYDVKKDVK